MLQLFPRPVRTLRYSSSRVLSPPVVVHPRSSPKAQFEGGGEERGAYEYELKFLDDLYYDIATGQCLCDVGESVRERALNDLLELMDTQRQVMKSVCGG